MVELISQHSVLAVVLLSEADGQEDIPYDVVDLRSPNHSGHLARADS